MGDPFDDGNIEATEDVKEKSSTFFWKQLLVCSSVFLTYFVCGLSSGSVTIYIAQMRKEANSTDIISQEMSSWLTSTHIYSALLWVSVWTTLTQYAGRRIAYASAFVIVIISFIVTYCSTTTKQLLIGEMLRGSGYACNISVSILIVSEYSAPQNRGLFLTIKGASLYWGIWVANTIGSVAHWRTIPLFAIVCLTHIVTVAFWPESPHWLASKGRFKDCALAHKWLKGSNKKSQEELKSLILCQKLYLKNRNVKHTLKQKAVTYFRTVTAKSFYAPLLLSVLVGLQSVAAGRQSGSLYALELYKKVMEGSEQKAVTLMLILDGISILGMYLGSVLTIFISRRLQLVGTGVLTGFFLLLISLNFYLIDASLIPTLDIFTIVLFSLFYLSGSLGPAIMCTTLCGEMIPSHSKSLYTTLYVLIYFLTFGIAIKITPYIFYTFKLHWTFLGYTVAVCVVTLLIYLYLPETKDKTLEQIEQYFVDSKLYVSEKRDEQTSVENITFLKNNKIDLK